MDINRINLAIKQAREARKTIVSSPPLDALFVAFYLDAKPTEPAPAKIAIRMEQDAFKQKLSALIEREGAFAGTATTVLRLLGYASPTVPDAKQCGIWLTALGYQKHKSNGQTLFTITE